MELYKKQDIINLLEYLQKEYSLQKMGAYSVLDDNSLEEVGIDALKGCATITDDGWISIGNVKVYDDKLKK